MLSVFSTLGGGGGGGGGEEQGGGGRGGGGGSHPWNGRICGGVLADAGRHNAALNALVPRSPASVDKQDRSTQETLFDRRQTDSRKRNRESPTHPCTKPTRCHSATRCAVRSDTSFKKAPYLLSGRGHTWRVGVSQRFQQQPPRQQQRRPGATGAAGVAVRPASGQRRRHQCRRIARRCAAAAVTGQERQHQQAAVVQVVQILPSPARCWKWWRIT